MTLEDETGFVNAVISESVFQRYSVLAKTMSFLAIGATLQVEDGVVHLFAEKLWEPRAELKPSGASSRNFH
jgi:error-prone DNA polymerase